MSAVPTAHDLGDSPRSGGTARRLPKAALAFYLLVATAAIAAEGPFLVQIPRQRSGWFTLAFFAVGAALAQLFVVATPRRDRNMQGTLSYHTTAVFLLPAALLLAPPLAVLVPIAQHLPEWLKKRPTWYIGTFNIFNYTLTILAALAVDRWVLAQHGLLPISNLRTAAAGLAACIAYVLVNHSLLAAMFRLGRRIDVRESGLFTGQSISAELVLAALGVGIATFWHSNPWLIPLALAPLVLINRSLSVPALQMEARIDPKTGLFNARHFAETLGDELRRAERFGRPLAVIMADLDLLRDINNRYGHLAGDAVLRGIADVFREELRDYDIPARFGGEEFSIVLPETTPQQALEIAERIRRVLAERRFHVETSSEPVRATVSIGVAGFPTNGRVADELIHQADLAVYRAKLQGRNCVLEATPGSVLPAKAERPQRIAIVRAEGSSPASIVPPRRSTRRPSRLAFLFRGRKRRTSAESIEAQYLSLEHANRFLRERSTAAMESLSTTVDARDSYTVGHSRRVQQLALAIGGELGLPQAELDLLGHAALFHDIGKLSVPDAILLKPAMLTDEEWLRMRGHAEEGAQLIDRLGFLGDTVPAIKHHHERYDGTGYPDGLRGEDIPIAARIIHVADALDSMLTPRVYREALPAENALDELRRAAGAQFCPRCVAALERVVAERDAVPPSQLAASCS